MSAQTIIDTMLLGTGYTLEDLRGRAKHDPRLVSLRRRIIHALGRAGYSTPEIGRLMNRDHTTVIYQLRQPVPL